MNSVFIFILFLTSSFTNSTIKYVTNIEGDQVSFGPVDLDHPEKPLGDVVSEMFVPLTGTDTDMKEHHIQKVLNLMEQIKPGFIEKHGLKFAHGKHTQVVRYQTMDMFDYVMTKGDLECAFEIEAPNPFSLSLEMRQ